MDDTKGCFVNTGLDERTDKEVSEKTEEENQTSHLTLHKKQIIEDNETRKLLCNERNPEAIESVHKYAKRIKSFLGWEPFVEEPVQNDSTEAVDKNDTEGLDTRTEEDENKDNIVGGEDNSWVISPESGQNKSEEVDNLESDFRGTPPKCESEPTATTDEITSETEDIDETVLDAREISTVDADWKDKSGLIYPEPESETKGSDELSSRTDRISPIEHCSRNGDSFAYIFSNGRDLIKSFPKNSNHLSADGEENLKTECIVESEQDTGELQGDVKNSDSINRPEYTCDESENIEELLFNTPETDQLLCSKSNNLIGVPAVDITPADYNITENFKTDIIVPSTEKSQNPDIENFVPPETENKRIVTEFKKKQNSDTITDDTEEPVADDYKLISRMDASKFNSLPNQETPSSDIASSTSINEQNEGDPKSNNNEFQSEEDLREDSMYFNDVNLKDNTKKPYMDEIRRLSIGIVKDVLASARNSVHEIILNKNEDKNECEISESCQLHKNSELFFANSNNVIEEHADKDKRPAFDDSDSLDQSSKKNDQKGCIVDDNFVCGFACFRPQWIQQYARPKAYLVLFSIIGVIHGCYYSYFVSIISTLEKRYAFQTKVSGTLLLADEITPLFLGVIVGYIGSRTHRPRMVAVGMFMSAACCFLSGLPYVIYGSAKHLSAIKYTNETGPEICETDMTSKECNPEDSPHTMTVVGIFLLASFLKGFATLSYYVIGISYMDDNIKKKNSPLYLAILLALRLLGPLLGFLMSSLFLKMYENPVDDPGYGPDDPRWVGAWWIGFFLQGALLVIFTLPIALFPRSLPGQKTEEKNTAPAIGDGWRQILAGFPSALKRLGKNPVFILLIINTNMKIFSQFGHSVMLPKYMENRFRLSASQASLYSGATSITFIMVATVFGGFIIWKYRPRLKLLLCGMIISEIIMCIGFLVLMIPRCQPVDMVNFGMNDNGLILNSVCNKDCECSTTSFTPFCGPDGKTYFSPCYAGCTHEVNSSKQKEFGNCSCLTETVDEEVSTITEGFCPDDTCGSQTLVYLIILLIMVKVSTAFTVVHTMLLLRSVHPKDKSIALGTFETFICLFGFIPFPITIGALVDSACLVWEESCGETGNCWFYDMDKFAYMLHGVSATFCFLSVLCCTGLYFLSSRLRDLYADEDEEKEYVRIKLDTVSGCETKQ